MSTSLLDRIYEPEFVRDLFDEMSRSYGIVNVISSFGFCLLWRRQCINQIEIGKGARVVDLMSGMGELNELLASRCGNDGEITGFDISPEMNRRAQARSRKKKSNSLPLKTAVIQADVLKHDFQADSADAVVSCFGLKTLDTDQLSILASRVHHILRPGGKFAFLEISVPRNPVIRWPYLFYLNRIIPVIGRILMGNPDNYRMLGIYTRAFGSTRMTTRLFRQQGLEAQFSRFFFGCATGIAGFKPAGD